mgnify:CR=1 FL=1
MHQAVEAVGTRACSGHFAHHGLNGVGMRFIAPHAAFGFSPKEGVGLQAASGKARLSGEVGIAWEAHSSRLQRSAAPTTLRVSPHP